MESIEHLKITFCVNLCHEVEAAQADMHVPKALLQALAAAGAPMPIVIVPKTNPPVE